MPRSYVIRHPAIAGLAQVLQYPRPNPDTDESATAQTIRLMQQMAEDDSSHPAIRWTAHAAIRGAGTSPQARAAAIHRWIRDHVAVVSDASLAGFAPRPQDAEVLIRPRDLIAMPQPQGDCDDCSMLAAAMLQAVGIPTAYRTIAADGAPEYSHVYVVAAMPDGELAIDASHGAYAGWSAQPTGKAKTWDGGCTTMHRTLRAVGQDDDTSWMDVLDTGITAAGKILGTRYAVPLLNPGQTISTIGPGGTQILSQAQPGAAVSLPGFSTSGSGTMLLIGGVVLAIVLSGWGKQG